MFGLLGRSAPAVRATAALRGVSHGGIPTLMQTPGVPAAPKDPDTANSLWVAGRNIAMAAGSLHDATVLDAVGTTPLLRVTVKSAYQWHQAWRDNGPGGRTSQGPGGQRCTLCRRGAGRS
ncbi:hypothetical protein [Kitasatospora sp. NPDC091207]|uniref:hypothetical protein n=1 Tax=Kitasatospora sp. NPDC091207 TaxID=3364083 RepID=UPI00381B8960